MRNLALRDLMENHLHGKKARVYSGVCEISDRMEGDVWLEYNKCFGLYCTTDLQWNTYKINKKLQEQLKSIDYDLRSEISENITNVINTFKVKIGQISYYDAKSFKITMEENSYKKDKSYLKSVEIIHNNGSITKIILERPK